MFTARILVILQPPITIPAAEETIRRACAASARPAGLRFALPHTMEGFLPDLPQDLSLLFYDAALGLTGVLPCLTDETHFLFLNGPHAFSPRWDAKLYAQWRRMDKHTLFTSSITPGKLMDAPADPQEHSTIRVPKVDRRRLAALRQLAPAMHKRAAAPEGASSRGILPHLRHEPLASGTLPQAHLPALKEVQPDDGIVLGRGLALVCADAPVKTLVIDPAFLFGPVLFLLQDEPLDSESLSLSAYMAGFSVYAFHEVLVWPLSTHPQQVLRLPPDALPGTTIARFEQLLGFHSTERRCDAKAAMGLFTHEDSYPQRTPGKLKLAHMARSAKMHMLESHMPLMVSAWVDLPNPRVTPAFYLLRFGFLRRIQSLPLTLYTGGSQERALRAVFPHTQSYPSGGLLPKGVSPGSMKAEEAFSRTKMLLVQRAAKRQVEFTHAAWVDMDILPHPVCSGAVPDFDALMDDRIHIATVNGVPDPSFVVVPVQRLASLTKLVQSITQLDAELARGFSEALLWERIFQRKPQWFAIHPMPRRRLLFLTAFDRRLLTRSVHPYLEKLAKPYYAELSDVPQKSRTEKEIDPNA